MNQSNIDFGQGFIFLVAYICKQIGTYVGRDRYIMDFKSTVFQISLAPIIIQYNRD